MFGEVLAGSVCGVLIAEIAARIPFARRLHAIRGNLDKAQRLMRSAAISDHFKERLVPVYSFRAMGASLSLMGLLVLAALPVVAAYAAAAAGMWAVEILAWPALAAMAVTSVTWLAVRVRRGSRSANGVESNRYAPLDRALHRLALSTLAMRELAFDLEKSRFLVQAPPTPTGNVFVCGLARSGTTALLDALSRAGDLASLRYQDMPFVLAPNTWSRIARPSRNADLRERAHGDGILINAQSPESFEEVFWSLFEGTSTRTMDALRPHTIDHEPLAAFRSYMRLVCLRYGASRYLSKNNTNIYRLDALAAALPDSRFLVPFRRPAEQAQSLIRQHSRFAASPSFEADYMGWIGHYEFGATLKPVAFGGSLRPGLDPVAPDYWLDVWIRSYDYLREVAGQHANIRLVCYEDMAGANPAYVAGVGSFTGTVLDPEDFRPAAARDGGAAFDPALLAMANGLYERMRASESEGERAGSP